MPTGTFGRALTGLALAWGAAALGCGGPRPSDTVSVGMGRPGGGAPLAQTRGAPEGRRIVEVRMLGDAQGYRFEPADVVIHPGDAVRWTLISGAPQSVAFGAETIPPGEAARLQDEMPSASAPLAGPLLTAPNAQYTVSFVGATPGVYRYYSAPHRAAGMTGRITVR
jgi:plastocyanin